MNSRERALRSREMDNDHFHEVYTRQEIAEKEQKHPELQRRRFVYAEQFLNLAEKLSENNYSPRKRARLMWNLTVLKFRLDNGPRIRLGNYDFNFLPKELALKNPQKRKISPIILPV